MICVSPPNTTLQRYTKKVCRVAMTPGAGVPSCEGSGSGRPLQVCWVPQPTGTTWQMAADRSTATGWSQKSGTATMSSCPGSELSAVGPAGSSSWAL